MSFVISCCSTSDRSAEWYAERNIKYICSHYRIDDGEMLPDDLGVSTPFPVFYQAQRNGSLTSTSQISPGEYEEYFEEIVKNGDDIIHISLSTGITTTCQSAVIAAENLREKYPERRIEVIDSLAATIGFGLLVDYAADLRDAGKSFDEIAAEITAKRDYVNIYGCTDDLKYLIRGGRVSKLSGTVGQILNVCPVLHVSPEGSLITGAKIRTLKKALKFMADTIETGTEEGIDFSGKVFIGHADNLAGAEMLSKMITEKYANIKTQPEINYIGTTIGSHTGPGLVAFAYFGKKREA